MNTLNVLESMSCGLHSSHTGTYGPCYLVSSYHSNIVCSKRTSCRNRRLLKGKRNDTCKETFRLIIGKPVSEYDFVFSKCVLHFHKGILNNMLYVSSTPTSDISIRHLGTKSHRFCTVCGKKETECKLFSARPVHKFFKNII